MKAHGPKPRSVKDRLEQHSVKTAGCWKWRGAKVPKGYGMLWVNEIKATRRAHRLAYEIYVGPVPDGMWVLHKCDNPECTNPDHLYLGTHQDNVDDKVRKGRQYAGPRHHFSKKRRTNASSRTG